MSNMADGSKGKPLEDKQDELQLEKQSLVEVVDSDHSRSLELRSVEDVMEDSYLRYSMSVIVSRALPDVRDGLKPVHRRILYAMEKMAGSLEANSSRVLELLVMLWVNTTLMVM